MVTAIFTIVLLYTVLNFSGYGHGDSLVTQLHSKPLPISSNVSKSALPESTALIELVSGVVAAVESSRVKQPPRPPRPGPADLHKIYPPHGSPSETTSLPNCPGYEQQLQQQENGPLSKGSRKFPYARPPPECRTFTSKTLEALLERMKGVIKDPDLYRLFENSYPNTLDTTIKWRGFASKVDPITTNSTVTDEELAFVITGDIDAMWLRDSASQIYSYLPLLEASTDPDSLASLWRGVINSQARYIIISPYCHSFQPPPESKIPTQVPIFPSARLCSADAKIDHRRMEPFTTTTPCQHMTLFLFLIASGNSIH